MNDASKLIDGSTFKISSPADKLSAGNPTSVPNFIFPGNFSALKSKVYNFTASN